MFVTSPFGCTWRFITFVYFQKACIVIKRNLQVLFNCSPWFEWIVSIEPVQTEEKSDSVTVTQESQQPSDPGGENNKNKSNSEENHTNSGQRVSKHRDKEIIVLQTGRNVELQIKTKWGSHINMRINCIYWKSYAIWNQFFKLNPEHYYFLL